ncbi:MAG: DRTGG domain-containing protein [Enterobacter hormaechei]
MLVAACLAAMNGVEIGAIPLTGAYEMDPRVSKLCERAFATGLPVFMVNTNTWQTSLSLQSFNPKCRLMTTSVSRKFRNTLRATSTQTGSNP